MRRPWRLINGAWSQIGSPSLALPLSISFFFSLSLSLSLSQNTPLPLRVGSNQRTNTFYLNLPPAKCAAPPKNKMSGGGCGRGCGGRGWGGWVGWVGGVGGVGGVWWVGWGGVGGVGVGGWVGEGVGWVREVGGVGGWWVGGWVEGWVGLGGVGSGGVGWGWGGSPSPFLPVLRGMHHHGQIILEVARKESHSLTIRAPSNGKSAEHTLSISLPGPSVLIFFAGASEKGIASSLILQLVSKSCLHVMSRLPALGWETFKAPSCKPSDSLLLSMFVKVLHNNAQRTCRAEPFSQANSKT